MEMITSGFNFEGYKIIEYCGYCTGECVLGTGFLSSLESGISDFFGMSSGMYENKLMQAKANALKQLKENANSLGGNAIIGVDIDYTTFSNDLMGVIANGTAVKIKKNINQCCEKVQTFPVKNYYRDIPFRPISVTIYENNMKVNFVVTFINYGISTLEALKIKMKLNTVFNDVINENIFTLMNFNQDGKYIYSAQIFTEMNLNEIQSINDVIIEVMKYKEAGEVKTIESQSIEIDINQDLHALRKFYGDDVITTYLNENGRWRCLCGTMNEGDVCALCKRTKMELEGIKEPEEIGLQYVLGKFQSARELQTSVLENGIFDSHLKRDEIIGQIAKEVRLERLYGINYAEAIQNIMKVVDE